MGWGGGRNYHPLSENHYFSGTKPPLDLKPVCKLKYVHCGPVEKNRTLYLSWFNRGGPTKFKNTFFQQEIFKDFRKNSLIFKKFSGDEFKSYGPHSLDSGTLYAYLGPFKNKI